MWFLDRGKQRTNRADQVLFIDAREIYNQIDRAHRDWTPQQVEFLANIVRLWRGQKPEFDTASAEMLDATFPDRTYCDVAGICYAAALEQIEEQGWSLNPGRYVGMAAGASQDIDFEVNFGELVEEWELLSTEALRLDEAVSEVSQLHAAPMTTLSELCTCVDYGYTASASDDPSSGPKFLRITDIVPESITWATVPHCEIEDRKRKKYLLDEGDIVVARTGATVGYAKQIWARPEGATFASYLVRFRPDAAKVDPYYLGQIVQSTAFKKWVKSVAGGAAQPNANAKLLGSFDIELPNLDIQRSVANILRFLDDLIEQQSAAD